MQLGRKSHAWESTVYFCEPWPWTFGIFGLAGMGHFRVTIDAYEEWSVLERVAG